MKFYRIIRISLIVGFLGTLNSGCVVDQHEQRVVMQQQREDNLLILDELRRMRGRLDVMESEIDRIAQQVNAVSSEQSRGMQGQMQGINATLDELQRRIQAVDAARENDKKEIVDSLARRIQAVMNTAPTRPTGGGTSSTPRRPISNEGYEHVVQPGETLSAIARAYKVSSADIVQANGLKSADVLRVGQKLFIPASTP
ncbi:MAG TPA: LysM domain-containing protein [Kiritimatiellia bacterium]|nr:LysM domain-containing protein [Kiritimatiellia bacterium]